MATKKLTLTDSELTLLQEAIDSHIYWTLADEHHRNDGVVDDVGSDETDSAEQIRDARELGQKLSDIEKGDGDPMERDADVENWALVTGTPFDGFAITGPFVSEDEAIDERPSGNDWWPIRMHRPEYGECAERARAAQLGLRVLEILTCQPWPGRSIEAERLDFLTMIETEARDLCLLGEKEAGQ